MAFAIQSGFSTFKPGFLPEDFLGTNYPRVIGLNFMAAFYKKVKSQIFIFLTVSYLKDKKKTKISLLKAWKSFSGLLPEILSVMMFAGITLAVLSPDTVSKLIGSQSGFFGVFLSLTAGSIALIPGFVAFPFGAALLDAGAGYAQIAAFVSSLIAVGIVTLPLEIKYFSKRMAILRNASALVISLVFTMAIWRLM